MSDEHENVDSEEHLGNSEENTQQAILEAQEQDSEDVIIETECIEQTEQNEKNEKNSDGLEEFSINMEQLDGEPMKLKKPNEVFYEIYREARRKAKMAKKAAMIAILEAKNIKNTYMLEDIEDSSDDDFDTETLEDEY